MATESPAPTSLAAWLDALDRVRLPALAGAHRHAQIALGSEHRTLREITHAIQGCPALALQIMRDANRQADEPDARATSLETALARIGVERAIELLLQIPRLNPEVHPPGPVFQAYLISQHACQQAHGLFSVRLARLWPEIQWNTLLFLAPLWGIIQLQPALLTCWEEQVLPGHQSPGQASQELLQVPLLALCQAVASRWKFPEWIQQGYQLLQDGHRQLGQALQIARHPEQLEQQRQLDARPDLYHWLIQPCNTLIMANSLALTAHHCWTGRQILRWQQLTSLYLGLPLADLQQLQHQQAARSARQHLLGGLWHPALMLVQPWDSHYPPPRAPAPHKVADSLRHWRAFCSRLQQTPSPFANLLELLTVTRNALLCAGWPRFLILQLDPRRHALVARQGAGLGSEALQLQLQLAYSPLLKQLLEQSRQLSVTRENSTRVNAHLPGLIKSVIAEKNFILRSLVSPSGISLLIIADHAGQPLQDTARQLFSQTMHCLDQALRHYRGDAR